MPLEACELRVASRIESKADQRPTSEESGKIRRMFSNRRRSEQDHEPQECLNPQRTDTPPLQEHSPSHGSALTASIAPRRCEEGSLLRPTVAAEPSIWFSCNSGLPCSEGDRHLFGGGKHQIK